MRRCPYALATVVSWLRSEQIDSRLAPDTVDSRHQEGLMNLDKRNRDFNTPAIKPISCFADIENLALLHQGQDELIRNSVASAIRTISLFPWAMTLNALCSTDTNKTIHRDHQFVVVPDPSWAACDGSSHRHLTASANEAGCLVDWENRVKVRSDDAFGASRSYLPILPKTLAGSGSALGSWLYALVLHQGRH